MSSPNNFEITGHLLLHPPAELIIELMQTRLDGSLRLSRHKNKTIIYVRDGDVVFAVSNQRQHRIFAMLLQTEAMTKEKLVEIPEFENDLALARALREKQMFSASSLKSLFNQQIEAILRDAVEWTDGVFTFSSLARVKDDIQYKVDVHALLIEYARTLPKEKIVRRFRSLKESFGKSPGAPVNINILPAEGFLLSRLETSLTPVDVITASSGLTESETLQNLYALWLAGFIYRANWNVAFNAHRLSSLSSAKLELKKKVLIPHVINTPEPQPSGQEEEVKETEEVSVIEEKPELTLEKYLGKVEESETHYELLNISHKATAAEIKFAYFGLAKLFHPDLFHKKTDLKTHRRIQNAFSEIARAYETLRDSQTRETYDFRLRKILQELDKLSPEEKIRPNVEQKALNEAWEIFERGFDLFVEEDFAQALPYFARAVHAAPDVARYQAYYGKVLAMDKNQRFKAEAALQTAVKLDADNPGHRIMLAQFFLQYDLPKRAEGELKRLLAIFPDYKEALALLDSLQNK